MAQLGLQLREVVREILSVGLPLLYFVAEEADRLLKPIHERISHKFNNVVICRNFY